MEKKNTYLMVKKIKYLMVKNMYLMVNYFFDG